MPRARTSERRQTIGTVNVDTRVWTKEVRAKTHHTWNPAHRGWGMSKDAWGEYSPLVDTLVLHDFDYKETWQVSVEKFNRNKVQHPHNSKQWILYDRFWERYQMVDDDNLEYEPKETEE